MIVRLQRWYLGSRVIPITTWRASSIWRSSFKTYWLLVFGLYLFGTGDALFIKSTLGNGPWVVLAQGLSLKLGLDIGVTTFILSCFLLLLWIPLKQRAGLGTLTNVVVISLSIAIGIRVIPTSDFLLTRILMILVGLIIIGVGSACYLTCGLGPGPRDGLMTGLHHTFGISIARARLLVEVTVVLLGWLLGGKVWIGTLIFALCIGRSVAISMGAISRYSHRKSIASDVS